jgi:mycothiol maleylpyruvate isomerase-like protein
MRDAAQLLQIEASAYRPLLEGLAPNDFDRHTVCDLWSVRDVIAHQSAVLRIINAGEQAVFTAESNQRDVDDDPI